MGTSWIVCLTTQETLRKRIIVERLSQDCLGEPMLVAHHIWVGRLCRGTSTRNRQANHQQTELGMLNLHMHTHSCSVHFPASPAYGMPHPTLHYVHMLEHSIL